ncbi:MAG: ABC transporter substrate-binding protein [Desulfobacteraceae bacterium]|nr:ABC transporter substrate-binding protein [Desulfobacteraceae bacterium]
MINSKRAVLFLVFILILFGCGQNQESQTQTDLKNTSSTVEKSDAVDKPTDFSREYAKLPSNITWLTNNSDPLFSSTKAEKGGALRLSILSFPMTFRTVGPDSNGSFRSAILDNQLSLINIHPNTENIIPELATHWAYDDDKKTMYFKLNKNARWSDKKPVTAWDFVYALEFMRSEHIIAPWYNDHYTKEIDKVIVYDDYTLAVKSTKAKPDLFMTVGITPVPAHFFKKLDKDFVHKYNWEIVPNTGPYIIADFKKGKFVRFERKKDWWAKDLQYFENRFNVDHVIFNVIRDYNMLFEYFKKGKIDIFALTIPEYWYEKSDISIFNDGYAEKIWFFNDTQQSAMGMWLNQDKLIFSDINVRNAFAHAMNIEKVITKVLRNDYFRLDHAYVGYGKYSNTKIKPRKYSIEKVESLMKESGWERGTDGIWIKGKERFSVEVTYGLEVHTPRLVVLKEEAKKAGVELKLQKLDGAATYKKILEKKHDVAWSAWGTGLRPAFWQHWHSENAHKPQTNNITNTDDPEIDGLIDQYRASLDETERIALSLQIQSKVHDQADFIPTFMVPYVRHGYWRWLKLPLFHGTKKSETLFDPFGSMTGGLFWFDQKTYDKTKKAMKNKEKFAPVTIKDEHFRLGADN